MKRFVAGFALLALAVALNARPAEAQLAGDVVWGVPGGVGVTVAGNFSRGLNDESGKTNFFGGRAVLGLPMFSVWAGGGAVQNGDTEVTFGGGAAVSVIKGPMLPVGVSLQAGLGYFSVAGFTTLTVPAGPVVTINVPSPAVDVTPWVHPRVHIQRVSNGTSDTDFGFGASAGVNVTLPMGFGGQVAVDWMTIGDPSVKPLMVGIGAHYKISVPSLGVM